MKRPVAELAFLLKEDFEVSVLLPRPAFGEPDLSLHHADMLRDVRLITYATLQPPVMYEQPIPGPRFLLEAWRVLRENDVVHMWVPTYLTSLLLLAMKRFFFPGKRLILSMDTVPGYSFSLGRTLDTAFHCWYRLFRTTLFLTPNIVHLYGKSLIPYAVRADVPRKRIRVIPTGVFLEKFQSGNRARTRRLLGLKKHEMMVLFAGLLVDRKGVDIVLK
ncbi:MAG: glycosyltransferase family 4 protein, partial [Nitrosarchaeum sp.]|nr:glycosyltransferase family 4 protein [Nitrosarchaeum sp.]